MTLEELRQDYDWAQVFADENAGNVSKAISVAPPGAQVNDAPMTRDDVAEIIASVDGANDEAEWLGVFLLKDGRYLVASGGCDCTGWECQAGNCLIVCANMSDVLQFGLSDSEKARLWPNGYKLEARP